MLKYPNIKEKERKEMATPASSITQWQIKAGKKTRAFLEEMKAYIPYERLEKLLIEEGVYRPRKEGHGGRPPYPSSVLLGALFLQSWYGLSDPMREELIHDRLSFRKFLDIRSDDDIPDETTICKFRNALMDKMLFDRIFDEINQVMKERGLILKEGSHIDTTLMHSSEPKRKKINRVKLSPTRLQIRMQAIPPKGAENITDSNCISTVTVTV